MQDASLSLALPGCAPIFNLQRAGFRAEDVRPFPLKIMLVFISLVLALGGFLQVFLLVCIGVLLAGIQILLKDVKSALFEWLTCPFGAPLDAQSDYASGEASSNLSGYRNGKIFVTVDEPSREEYFENAILPESSRDEAPQLVADYSDVKAVDWRRPILNVPSGTLPALLPAPRTPLQLSALDLSELSDSSGRPLF